MMKKRILALILAAALVLSVGSTGTVLAASAAPDFTGATAATKGSYVAASAIQEGSLLKGLAPFVGTDTTKQWTPYQSKVADLTDGEFAKQDASNRVGFLVTNHGVQLGQYANFTFSLGKKYKLTHFLVASEYEKAQWVKMVRVYASESLATLYDATNLVVDATVDGVAHYFKGAETTGSYVGFSFYYDPKGGLQKDTLWWEQIRFGELAAYGELVGAADKEPDPELDWSKATALEKGSYMPATYAPKNNLIAGQAPFYDLWESMWYNSGGTTEELTDGKFAQADGSGRVQYNVWWGDMKVEVGEWANFTFTLDRYYDLTHFLLGSEAGSAQFIKRLKIYVSQKKEDLYKEENVVADGTVSGQNNFIKGITRTGKYIGFSFYYDPNGNKQKDTLWWGLIRIGELGVYGKVSDLTAGPDVDGAQVCVEGTDMPAGTGSVDLRIGTVLRCRGAKTGNDYAADFSEATVVTEEGTYPLKKAGTLLSLRDNILKTDRPAEDILKADTLSEIHGVDVPAAKLYEVRDDEVVFTALLEGVDFDQYTTEVIVRGYATYEKDGQERTIYGPVKRICTYDVWRSAAAEDDTLTCLDRAEYLQESKSGGYFRKDAHVVFLGDSITHSGQYVRETFRYYLNKHPEDQVQMFTASPIGVPAKYVQIYLDDYAMTYEPDYVVMMYGMNDIGRNEYSTGYDAASDSTHRRIDGFEENMRANVELLQSRGIKVILCTPTTYDDTTTGATGQTAEVGCAEALRRCAVRVRNIAKDYGCLLVEFNAPMNEATEYVQNVSKRYSIINDSDRVHPTVLAHDMMARILLNAIGEEVPMYSKEKMLEMLKTYGLYGSYNMFQDIGLRDKMEALEKPVDDAIAGINVQLQRYWQAEYYYVGYANYYLSAESKIKKVQAGHYSDMTGGQFGEALNARGSRMITVKENTAKVCEDQCHMARGY